MGQYRTKRLTVTKSYLRYKSRRIPVSEIAAVEQPRNNPPMILLGLGIMVGTLLMRADGLFLLFGLLCFIAGCLPPNTLTLTTKSGQEIHLNLTQERSPHRAMNTIRANVAEFQHKGQLAAAYMPPPSQMRLNPEEHIRQYVLQLLTIKFGFSQADIGYEFSLQMGSSQKRADVVVFSPGARHTQDNVRIIVECKRYDVGNDAAALDQLKSYMTVCINARFGVVASYRWLVIEKVLMAGRYEYRTIPVLINAYGTPLSITYAPGQPVEPDLPELDAEDDSDDLIEEQVIEEELVSPIPRLALRYGILLIIGCFALFLITSAIPSTSAPPVNVPLAERTWVTSTPSASPSPTTRIPETKAPAAATITESPLESTAAPINTSVEPALITVVSPTATTGGRVGVIQASRSVNLRMSPTTSGMVIMSVSPGRRVTILGANDDGSWLRVRIDGSNAEGWIAAYLVQIENR